MLKAYNYLVNNEVAKKDTTSDAIYDWYKSIDDFKKYRRDFGYSLNKFMSELNLSYDQARVFENHGYKSATPIVVKIYNFYHNEKNRLPKIDWAPNENNGFIAKQDDELVNKSFADANVITQNDEILLLNNKIKHLELLNEELNKQITRYEKLIDRL